jgi:hypothetical protein
MTTCGECLQRRVDARAAAAGGFSRDAGIDDAIIELLLLQALASKAGQDASWRMP